MIQNSKSIGLDDWNVPSICNEIRKNGLLMSELEVEYRKANKAVLTRPIGFRSLALSSSFMEEIEAQLNEFRHKVLLPIIKEYESNFKLSLKITSKGLFSFDHINISFLIECEQNAKTLEERFRKPFGVLMPFAEYISHLRFRGHNFKISRVECDLTLSIEDLLDVIEYPIAGPRVKKDWYSFATEAVEDAKNHYAIDIQAKCFEGEIEYSQENSVVQLQHLEYCSEGVR